MSETSQSLPPPPVRFGALMRMNGLIRKEFLQILRDPSSIAIAFLMPFFLLLLFGYGVSLDAEHVPVALVVEAPRSGDSQSCRLLYGFALFRADGLLKNVRSHRSHE